MFPTERKNQFFYDATFSLPYLRSPPIYWEVGLRGGGPTVQSYGYSKKASDLNCDTKNTEATVLGGAARRSNFENPRSLRSMGVSENSQEEFDDGHAGLHRISPNGNRGISGYRRVERVYMGRGSGSPSYWATQRFSS